MERHKVLKKAAIFLTAVSMAAILFAGCQSKDSTNTANAKNNRTAQGGGKRQSPEEMKKQIQEEIQPLIKAGTITQAQADKIVDAITTRNNGSGNNPNNGNSSNNGSKGNQNSNSNSNQNNSQQSGNQNNGQRQKFNPLSKLVSDGTITQVQADAVMEKMKGNFNRNGNGNSNSSNNSTSQSNGSK